MRIYRSRPIVALYLEELPSPAWGLTELRIYYTARTDNKRPLITASTAPWEVVCRVYSTRRHL
jgi:hypothetical protein